MAELEWRGIPERAVLRRAIRHRLLSFDASLQVIAESFLSETTPIDLLGIGGEGELVVVRIGGADDDAQLLTDVLADRVWLRPRLTDWLKLAPELDLDPDAEIRALLVCSEFGASTRSAVHGLSDGSIELLVYRCLRQRGQLDVLLESAMPARSGSHRRRTASRAATRPAERVPGLGQAPTAPPSPSRFRTGLTEADLARPTAELSEGG